MKLTMNCHFARVLLKHNTKEASKCNCAGVHFNLGVSVSSLFGNRDLSRNYPITQKTHNNFNFVLICS